MNSYGDSFTLVHADLVTGYGGRLVRDWDNATQDDYAGSIQAQSATEETSGRQVTVTSKKLLCDAGVPLTAVDRVVWGGKTYEVEGEPETHYMMGRADHIEAVLSLIEEASA